MKQFCSLVVLLAVSSFLLADKDKDNDKAVKKELVKFEGTWKIESMVIDGKEAPPEVFKEAKLVCKGDQFTMTHGDVVYKGTFKVDPSKKPKEIDVTFTEGPEKGKTVKGIYEVDDETYKVCMSEDEKDRPKKLESKEGSGHVLEILKKVKEKK